MPEGDTVWRAAQRLGQAFHGRAITHARSSVSPAFAERIPGMTVTEVEPRGKHLLIHFDGGLSLHGHLGMTGRWKVRESGGLPTVAPGALRPKWLRLECDGGVATCSAAPVIELIPTRELPLHPALRGLGADVLKRDEMAAADPVAYARSAAPTSIGELLLDQRLVAGIGNIFRCETLFRCGINPAKPVGELGDDELTRLVATASELMQRSLGGRSPSWVHRRAGRPCLRCGTTVRSAMLGPPGTQRRAYWCPRCQPAG